MIDTLIIGGGAAGLYLASFLPRPVILERDGICGRKLLLTGGGRCNYTNVASPEEMSGRMNGNKAFIRRVLYSHSSEEIISHMRSLGIEPAEEDLGRILPRNGNAETVLSALLSSRPRIIKGCAGSIEKHGGSFIVRTGTESIEARRVVLATGGMSYPQTGSDGSGYELARKLGHSLTAPYPALAPIALMPSLARAEGISWHVTLSAGKRKEEGEIIITRRGISGPAALNISRFLQDDPEIGISFASIDRDKLRMESGSRTVKNALDIPPRLSEALLGAIADRKCGNLSRVDLDTIERQLTHFKAKGKAIKEGAMNTRGGVPSSEIDPRTMESRIVQGLYIIGDMIDVDGPTGGFSLTWAFATAWCAARGLSPRK